MPKPSPIIKSASVPRGSAQAGKILTAGDDIYLCVILYKNGGEAEEEEDVREKEASGGIYIEKVNGGLVRKEEFDWWSVLKV